MAKDPAFLFYPGDWQLGTMHLTLLEKGCYMELLILQFAKGKFTEAQAKHMLNGSFDLAWPTLSEKFSTDGTFYWNERLRKEKDKRQKFTESRRSNGSIKKNVKNEPEHMLKHMEDINKDCIVLGNTENPNAIFDAEKEIGGNQIQFERMCMTTGFMDMKQAKVVLRKFHLWLEEKQRYPQTKKQVYAGFEKWLMNEPKDNGNNNDSKKKMVI